MSKIKEYDYSRGVLMDGTWDSHKAQCERCGRFDSATPATAAEMCLEGAVLYKRDNVARPQSGRGKRDEHFASKAQMKAVTRYKE